MTLVDLKQKRSTIKERGSAQKNVALTDFLMVDDNLIVVQYPSDSDILKSALNSDGENDKVNENL